MATILVNEVYHSSFLGREHMTDETTHETNDNGLPRITLLWTPFQTGDIDISQYLSNEDLAILLESKIAIAEYISGEKAYLATASYSSSGSNFSSTLGFYGPDGWFRFFHIGSSNNPWKCLVAIE